MISKRDGEQPHRHEQTLHAIRRLGVGELEAGNRDHDFARRQDDVGDQLPVHTWTPAMINLELNPPDHNERERREKKADSDLPQRCKREDFADGWIKPVIEHRNHRENEDPVHHVDLLRQESNSESGADAKR